MADIFEEVEEGIRQDKWAERWRKYGIFAYLFAGLIIGGTALNEYIQYSRNTSINTNTLILENGIEALGGGDYEGASTSFDGLVEEDVRISLAAGHLLAQVKIEANGDQAAAVDVLSDIAGDLSAPTEKLALIKAAYLQADSLSRDELGALLAPLREDETSAFNALAVELLAAKAIADGDYAYAREELTFLRVASNVPPGTQERVQKALASLPPTAPIADPEALPPEDVDP